MLLRQFMLPVGPLESNGWLLADEDAGTAALIDAGAHEPAIAALCRERGLRLTHILLTHLHWDHVDGLADYLKEWPEAAVIAPAPVAAAPGARIVGAGDRFEAAGFGFEVFRTSGHTPESISHYCADAGICFVGDAIFAGSVGGTSDDARFNEQRDCILRNLMTLPPATALLSGHGPATTVAIEQAGNPFLRPGFGRTA
jgi:glyoxylase-like metal-dependent hydrolase (beta-lactamase superfamily II)